MSEWVHKYHLYGSLWNPPCIHMDPDSTAWNGDDILSVLVKCKLEHMRHGVASYDMCRTLHRCSECDTEIQVDWKMVDSVFGLHVLLITKWQRVDIDALLQETVAEGSSPVRNQSGETKIPSLSKIGAVRLAFEKKGYGSVRCYM